MMDPNLLSIIVRTTGSNLTLLRKSLLSIEKSDYKTIEIIIVYQGLNQEKLNLIENFNLTIPFKVILNEVEFDDRSKNLNIGIQNSKGRFLAFLDDDDYVATNHYSNLINKINHDKSSFAFCLSNVVNEKGAILEDLFKNRYLDKVSLLKDNFITIHSFVLDKHRIDINFLKFKEDLKLAEDYIFILPFYLHYKSSFVTERTSFYLIHDKESNSFTKYKENNEFTIQRKLMKKYKKKMRINILEKLIIYFKRWIGKTKKV
jgi:hypothetical protein